LKGTARLGVITRK